MIIQSDLLEYLYKWFLENSIPFLISGLSIIIAYIIIVLINKQLKRLENKGAIEDSNAKNLRRIFKIAISIIVLIIVAIQFSDTLSIFAGIITVGTSTVIGFASMNTIGNLLAGIIIIISKPFKVGDRIYFLKRIADVVDIKLIYTILEDIDGVQISVPNQKLLQNEVQNYGVNKILRRQIFVTAGYDVDIDRVESTLLETAKGFPNILKFPQPRVDVYDFLDNAIKYRLIVFINNSKLIPKLDFQLKKALFNSLTKAGIDLRTPVLLEHSDDWKKESRPK